ncbi:MAG: AAA family ATPase, partial [Planctomycetota bacterium]
PYAVVLLDEIEKAHPDVYNMLLQIMEEGRLTDSFGRQVDFRNVLLIMTSNIGASIIKNQAGLGFSSRDVDKTYEKMKANLMNEVNRHFRPEFLNRLDDVMIFRPLSEEDLTQILDIELKGIRERLASRGLVLELSEMATNVIIKNGTNLDLGARPLRRAVERFIEDALSEELLKGSFEGAKRIIAEAENEDVEALDFTAVSEPVTEEPSPA